jgi:hypothetical protein
VSRGEELRDVPLKRDETWWLHPALRGRQSLPTDAAAGGMPHRWVHSSASAAREETNVDDDSPHADFAKILYRLNGSRPGPVRGFYVIVGVEPGRYAVGQLCADPHFPVQLFEDLVFPTEEQARDTAAAMRAASPPLSI